MANRTTVHLDKDLVEYLDQLSKLWRTSARSSTMRRILDWHKSKYGNDSELTVEELEEAARKLETQDLIRLIYAASQLLYQKQPNQEFQEIFEKVTISGCTEPEIIQYCAENEVPIKLQNELIKILEAKKGNGKHITN